MKKFIKNNLNYIVSCITILLILWLCSTFPKTGDDFGKGASWISIAFEGACALWKGYNGRVFGNTLVNMLNYSNLFRTLLQTIVIVGIIYFTAKITSNKKAILLSFVLMFSISIPMFRESISWMSGFANFGIPALMIALLIYNFKNAFKNELEEYKLLNYIIAILCAIFMNLFSEHTSIFSVLIGIGFIIVSFINHKKINKIYYVYLLTSIVFCALMFASPVYWNGMPRLNNADYYNSLSLIKKIYYNLRTTTWMNNMVFDNVILNIIISLLLLKNFKKGNKYEKIANVLLCFLTIIVFPLMVQTKFEILILTSKKLKFVLVGIYFVLISGLVIMKFNLNKIIKLLSYFLGAFVAAMPLLLAYGIGPRCFFASYVLLMFFTVELANELNVFKYKYVNCCLIVAGILFFGSYLYVHNENYKVTLEREKIISENKDKLFISLPKYKYPDYIHQTGTPGFGGYHYKVYLSHYGLDENTVIEFYDELANNNVEENEIVLHNGFILIPTYDGSNEPTHPNVIKLDKEVSGYKYWMVMTPWPNNQNKYENPSILVSIDGIKWAPPIGIINPVSKLLDETSGDYYSDPYLYYDDEFHLIYRYNPYDYKGQQSKVDNNLILEQTSKDGINWTEAKILFDDKEGQAVMSPSYIYNANKERIYYVNYDQNIYYRENKKEKWNNPKIVKVEGLKSKIWHKEIRYINNVYVLLAFADNKLYLASSKDGVSFENTKELDISNFDLKWESSDVYNRVYKSSILFEENKISIYIPYNTKTSSYSKWQMYLKQIEFKDLEWLFNVK